MAAKERRCRRWQVRLGTRGRRMGDEGKREREREAGDWDWGGKGRGRQGRGWWSSFRKQSHTLRRSTHLRPFAASRNLVLPPSVRPLPFKHVPFFASCAPPASRRERGILLSILLVPAPVDTTIDMTIDRPIATAAPPPRRAVALPPPLPSVLGCH